MNRTPPFDDDVARTLLRLMSQMSDVLERALKRGEGRAQEEKARRGREDDAAATGAGAGDAAAEAAARRLMALLEGTARAEAPGPPTREEAPEAPRVRPGARRPGRGKPGRAEPAAEPHAAVPAPSSGVPSLKVWRRAVALPEWRAAEELRQVVGWLESEVASMEAKGEDAAAREPRRDTALPAPSASVGGLEERAARPSREAARRLARRILKDVRPLLEKLAELFRDSDYSVTMIRRQAGATDWHVKLFRRELGLSPKSFALACRLAMTLWLLRETSLSVEEIASRVGFGTEGGVRKHFRRSCGFSPSQARKYLRRVRREYQSLGDELLSWHFWVRHHRGELEAEDLRVALDYLENRFDP